MPVALLPIPASKRWGDNSVLVFGLAWLVGASLIKINYTFNEDQNREQYYAGSILFFCGFMLIEMAAISIIAKSIPPKMKTSFWNAGLFGGTADTLGRGIGSFLFTAYTLRRLLDELLIAYVVSAVGCLIFLVLALIWFRRLKPHLKVLVGEKAEAAREKTAARIDF